MNRKIIGSLLIIAGLALGIAAAVYFIYFLIGGISRITSTDFKLDAPGEAVFSLDTGDYTVFYEHPRGSPDYLSGLEILVFDPEGGEIALKSNVSSNYSFGDRKGSSVCEFKAESSGKYRVVIDTGDDSSPALFVLIKDFTKNLLAIIFACIAIMFIGGGIALGCLILGIVFIVKDHRDRQAGGGIPSAS